MTAPQEQFAEVIRRSQAAAAEVVQAWATITKSPTGAAAAAPPTSTWDSAALIDQAFDFAARMLADQRDLTKKLIQLSGQLAETAQAETASAVSSGKKRAKSTSDAASRQAESTFGAARERAEEARQAAIDATDMMLQTARQGAETMFEAAKDGLPFAANAGSAGDVSSQAPGRAPREPAQKASTKAPAKEAATPRRGRRPAAERAADKERRTRSAAPARATRKSKPGPKPAKVVPPEYDSMGKAELQALLVAHGLPKSGNVPELRDRLRAHDAS